VAFEIAPSALEAALIEADDIKRYRPPYNIALTSEEREVWFASRDLAERSPCASSTCPLGPFPSAQTLDEFAALARAPFDSQARSRQAFDTHARSGQGVATSMTVRWGIGRSTFDAGYERLCEAHPELSRHDRAPHARLLELGSRLWNDGRRDTEREEPHGPLFTRTPEYVQTTLEWIALRAALAVRRAHWLTRLVDAALVWSEPGTEGRRMIVIENGEVVERAAVRSGASVPIPPGHRRSRRARHDGFTVARFDRLRVLTTELKRLVSDGAHIAVRFDRAAPLSGARLARALWWV
jgi:DNA polymerase-3 subunit epsilon